MLVHRTDNSGRLRIRSLFVEPRSVSICGGFNCTSDGRRWQSAELYGCRATKWIIVNSGFVPTMERLICRPGVGARMGLRVVRCDKRPCDQTRPHSKRRRYSSQSGSIHCSHCTALKVISTLIQSIPHCKMLNHLRWTAVYLTSSGLNQVAAAVSTGSNNANKVTPLLEAVKRTTDETRGNRMECRL